jgi:hypothetical protein
MGSLSRYKEPSGPTRKRKEYGVKYHKWKVSTWGLKLERFKNKEVYQNSQTCAY